MKEELRKQLEKVLKRRIEVLEKYLKILGNLNISDE